MRRAVGPMLSLVVLAVADAAVASGGWYLLIPPRSEYNERANFLSGFRILTEEPLSKWFQEGAYDSASDCDAVKTALTGVEHRSFELSADEYRKALGADPKALGRGADGKWFNVTLAEHQRFTTETYNANVDALRAARCIRSDDSRLRR